MLAQQKVWSFLLSVVVPCSLFAECPKQYGQRQVQQLIDDRPSVGRTVVDRERLHAWLNEQFEGHSEVGRIVWDHTEPASGRKSEYFPRFYASGSPAYIRLTNNPSVKDRDLVILLIFELANVRNSVEAKEIAHLAAEGEIDSEEFFKRNARLEYSALIKTKSLVADLFPLGIAQVPGTWEVWLNGVADHFDLYFERKRNDQSYRTHFQRSFERYRAIGKGYSSKKVR